MNNEKTLKTIIIENAKRNIMHWIGIVVVIICVVCLSEVINFWDTRISEKNARFYKERFHRKLLVLNAEELHIRKQIQTHSNDVKIRIEMLNQLKKVNALKVELIKRYSERIRG